MISLFLSLFSGVGYLLGAALLTWSYYAALTFCVILIGLAFPWAAVALDRDENRRLPREPAIRRHREREVYGVRPHLLLRFN